jgi:hypothetical protein
VWLPPIAVLTFQEIKRIFPRLLEVQRAQNVIVKPEFTCTFRILVVNEDVGIRNAMYPVPDVGLTNKDEDVPRLTFAVVHVTTPYAESIVFKSIMLYPFPLESLKQAPVSNLYQASGFTTAPSVAVTTG